MQASYPENARSDDLLPYIRHTPRGNSLLLKPATYSLAKHYSQVLCKVIIIVNVYSSAKLLSRVMYGIKTH